MLTFARPFVLKWENKQPPQQSLENSGKTWSDRRIRVGKKQPPATVIGNPSKPMGKQHFQAMGADHTSAPSGVRTVESIGSHWGTIGETSDSLHNLWAPTFRGRRRIYICYSYRKPLKTIRKTAFPCGRQPPQSPSSSAQTIIFLRWRTYSTHSQRAAGKTQIRWNLSKTVGKTLSLAMLYIYIY